jgi:hypothetical protein
VAVTMVPPVMSVFVMLPSRGERAGV